MSDDLESEPGRGSRQADLSRNHGPDHDRRPPVFRLTFFQTGDRRRRSPLRTPPTIQGFGTSGGFEFQLQDKTGGDINKFNTIGNDFLAALSKRPEIQYASTSFNPNFLNIKLMLM